jgi:bifunctional non-homologous end joining protein LigD
VRLVSRTGYLYRAFAPLCSEFAATVKARSAVLDGELTCLAHDGRPDFKALLYRRADAYFHAFDLLWLDGEDLRALSLLERKRLLRRIVPRRLGRVRYVGHLVGRGVDLFRLACERDLEGIVAKLARSAYRTAGDYSPWVKVKNREYSQARDRHELFDWFKRRSA